MGAWWQELAYTGCHFSFLWLQRKRKRKQQPKLNWIYWKQKQKKRMDRFESIFWNVASRPSEACWHFYFLFFFLGKWEGRAFFVRFKHKKAAIFSSLELKSELRNERVNNTRLIQLVRIGLRIYLSFSEIFSVLKGELASKTNPNSVELAKFLIILQKVSISLIKKQ